MCDCCRWEKDAEGGPHGAALRGNAEALRLLLLAKKGSAAANKDARSGETLLHAACRGGSMDCVEVAAEALKESKGWLEERAKDGSRCESRAPFLLVLNSLILRMGGRRGGRKNSLILVPEMWFAT
jgi:ankyrin repeat protein